MLDWEDGIVMLVASLFFAITILVATWKFTNGLTVPKWSICIPTFICILGIIFGLIMMLLPNGTGGFTQDFYLGIFMYSLCMFVFTSIIEIAISIIRHITK